MTYAKSRPGQIRYGTNGTGGSLHLAIRLLEISAGLDLVHVPYRNITQVNLDVISGEIDMASLALPNATANRSNVRLLAQTGSVRHPLLADVPTTAEAGFPNVAVIYWLVSSLRPPPRLRSSARWRGRWARPWRSRRSGRGSPRGAPK